MDRAKSLACLIAAVALWFSGCSSPRAVIVGSKNFTEQVLLGEIVAQHLEQRLGTPVTRRLNLGGTLLAHRALTAGQIDLYPEYTGTALLVILGLPPETEPRAVLRTVRAEYRDRFRVSVLDPLGFENGFAMVVRGKDARAAGLRTLSDAARYPAGWTLGAGYEFLERADGWPALVREYRLPVKSRPRTMDLGLLYRALEQGQVNIIAANATDGLLSAMDLAVLRDDKRAFPPYEAFVAVREESLQAFSGLKEALASLSGKITASRMSELNHEVDGKHRPVHEVARAFLRSLTPE
jgi:glycine betaine/choline ABC-type transport system substrate-binding protein